LNTDGLSEIAESIRVYLDAKHRAREEALALSREVIRLSANAIRAVHRHEFETARELIARAKSDLERTDRALAEHPDVFYAGFVHDAQKEFAEAGCTLALVAGQPLPTPEDLGVMAAAYLNGLGETLGELRRHLLDSLRLGDIEHCEDCLAAMGDIYDTLVTMDYPEAVTSGLRRTTDAMRAILERTRGDFTMAAVQRRLEQRIAKLEERLGPADADT
jgi:translin